MEQDIGRILRETHLTVQSVGVSKTIEALVEARNTPEVLQRKDTINKFIVTKVAAYFKLPQKSIRFPKRKSTAVPARTICFLLQSRYNEMTGPELEIYWEIKRSNISKYMTDFNMFSGESNDEKLLIAGHEKLKKEVERYLQKLS